jgi:hypothetical protein
MTILLWEKDWRGIRTNENGLPSHHQAYCDLRLYQQRRFMARKEALLLIKVKQQLPES